jgi:hypothetical protein
MILTITNIPREGKLEILSGSSPQARGFSFPGLAMAPHIRYAVFSFFQELGYTLSICKALSTTTLSFMSH